MRVERIRPRIIPSEQAKVAQLREIGERLRSLQTTSSLRFTQAGNELSLHAESLRQTLLDGRGYSLANLAFEVERVAHFAGTGVIAPGSEVRLTDWLDKLQSPTAFYGGQWGEEGKRQVEYSYGHPSMVVRFLGGPNAGSVITTWDGEKTPLVHFPGGVLNPSVERVILAHGTNVSLATALAELRNLQKMQAAGRLPAEIKLTPDRITIDPRCHVNFKHHGIQSSLFRDDGVGTEETGNGATTAGIYGRQGDVTLAGLAAGDVTTRVALLRSLAAASGLYDALNKLDGANRITGHSDEFKMTKVLAEQQALLAELRQYADIPAYGVGQEIVSALKQNKIVHFLATQGFGLDPRLGIRPYVTSNHTGTAGLSGLDVPEPLELIPEHMAVVPAYLTVKGDRPFMTEIKDPALAQKLRVSAGQFDRLMRDDRIVDDITDTKHRVGYMDAVMLAHYLGLNHVTQAALTKLDVWDGFDTVRVGVGYEYDGPDQAAVKRAFGDQCEDRGSCLRITAFDTSNIGFLRALRPVYREFPWGIQVKGINKEADLPKEAVALISFLEQATDIPFHVIKTGPGPEAMFLRNI